MKTDKIVILGGGSAGWMTAATLIRTFPEKSITVIESPDVPIAGVGESTLGQIIRWIKYLGIEDSDFVQFTDATYKLSIKFTDFCKKGEEFHYPFGVPMEDGAGPADEVKNWHLLREFYPEMDNSDMVKWIFPASELWENNKFNENNSSEFGNFSSTKDRAYHFDAAKFGLWLKDYYCIPRGVKYISGHVEDISTNSGGIEFLHLKGGESVSSDLFVDCTGFRSLLLGGALEEPFVSYASILPNDSAWATQIPYRDKYKELELYTNCTAIENGWVWNIPLWSRIGTGYVFSSLFVSDEESLEEFKNHLQSDNMVCPRTREEVDSYTYRKIDMRIGVHERGFVKNVVAIGLSAGFIEPLESNGLLSVHEFLFVLIDVIARENVTQLDRTWFNIEIRDIFDGFAKFVAIHYAMSQRDDTDYWTANMNREYPETITNTGFTNGMVRASSFYNAQRMFFDALLRGGDHIDGITYIATGMGFRYLGGPRLSLLEHSGETTEGLDLKVSHIHEKWTTRRDLWSSAAKESPHIVDYLKRRFYSE